jgi:hypothetical protein
MLKNIIILLKATKYGKSKTIDFAKGNNYLPKTLEEVWRLRK